MPSIKRPPVKNETVAAILGELDRHRLADGPTVANGGKHYKIRWRVNGGPPRTTTAPCTPSDIRGHRNARARVRRLLRQDGAELKLTRQRKPRAQRSKPTITPSEVRAAVPKPAVIPIRIEIPEPQIRTIEAANLTPALTAVWRELRYDQPVPVTTLAAALGKGRAVVSTDLSVMKGRGLVRNPRRGLWIRNPIP
jgi:hypothetical protein